MVSLTRILLPKQVDLYGRYLLVQLLRGFVHVVVELVATLLDVGELRAHFVEDHLGVVVEEHAHRVVTQRVADAVLVRVVHPLGDPEHGDCLGRLLVFQHHFLLGALQIDKLSDTFARLLN